MKRSLTEDEIRLLFLGYFNNGESQASLANRFSITPKAVYNILYLQTYQEYSSNILFNDLKVSSMNEYIKKREERKKLGLGRKA